MPDLQNDSSSSTTGFLAQLPPRPTSTDDMDDRAEIAYYREAVAAGKPGWKPLLHALELFQRIVAPAFGEEDQLALKFQSRYQWFSLGAVGMGAVTVCLAIIQLAAHLHANTSSLGIESPCALILEWAEITTAAFTFLIVVIAIAIRPKERWLAARFKAEVLRVFKFKKLCDSRLWSGHSSDRANLENELRAEISEVRRRTFRDAEDWATQGTIPTMMRVATSAKCGDAQDEFIRYYRGKRMEAQMSYLERKARQREEQGVFWSFFLQVLFWLSLASVLGHAGVSLDRRAGGSDFASNLFIAVAAILPVAAGAVRTYKSSREFERNAARHDATLFILEKLATQLDASQSCEESYATVGFCEQVLEADSREWMRLMVSAEWYG